MSSGYHNIRSGQLSSLPTLPCLPDSASVVTTAAPRWSATASPPGNVLDYKARLLHVAVPWPLDTGFGRVGCPLKGYRVEGALCSLARYLEERRLLTIEVLLW
ncbi:unnamed protein product, partial [Iphiclides podalirius]